jgi:predicted phage tail protein
MFAAIVATILIARAELPNAAWTECAVVYAMLAIVFLVGVALALGAPLLILKGAVPLQ